jgi:NAD(P)-dependent dehydrogenase (short-subunit alcohol dehydrogenase family)
VDGLRGKVALVTGGGSGIGRATAHRLAREGASVAVVDIREEPATRTTEEIRASGGTAAAVRCDVTQAAQVKEAVATIASQLGGLSLLVNAAGIFTAEGSVVDCDEQNWDRVLAVNLKAAFLTAKHAVPEMRKGGGGAIVNIASVYGFRGLPGECAYDASKGAVINLTRQMAMDFAREGIRVNAVCPSDCDTPLLEALFEPGVDPDTEKRRLGEAIPMGRLAQPSDIAAAIAFLCSDDAAFITGVSLPVDGGYLAR